MHQTRSELDCSHKCLSNPKCASFNFEIQQSRSLSICELNNVSRTSSNNKLERNDSFAYYEKITPMERSEQEIAALSPTTSKIITEATTTQGTQDISASQDIAATPASSVPSTQSATTAAPGKWYAFKLRWGDWTVFGRFFLKLFPQLSFLRRKFSVAAMMHGMEFKLLQDRCYSQDYFSFLR